MLEPAVGTDLNDWARRDISWSAQLVAAPITAGVAARPGRDVGASIPVAPEPMAEAPDLSLP